MSKLSLLLCSIILFNPLNVYGQKDNDSNILRLGGHGMYSPTEDYILEQANWGVNYRCVQTVIEDATGIQKQLVDTLLLALGQNKSVFFNTSYISNYKRWAASNRSRVAKATKPCFARAVPIETVIEKWTAGSDHMDANIGEPVQIYKDRVAGSITSCVVISPPIQCEQDSDQFSHWDLLDSTKVILGYQCIKAQTYYGGHNYEAWFTLDIPISDGPWKFCGLPGLILQVESEDSIFRYEAISIEQYENAVISMSDNLEKCNLSYFNKTADYERSNVRSGFLFDGEAINVISHPYTYYPKE